MKRRLLVLLVAGLVIFACATTAIGSRTHIFRVENANWAAATLVFECQGMVLDQERGIETGERRQGQVRLRDCTAPRFGVRLLARPGDIYVSPPIQGWVHGTILDIKIENHLPLTSFYVVRR